MLICYHMFLKTSSILSFRKEVGLLIPHLEMMNAPTKLIPAGARIMEEGAPGKDAYVLQEGEVIVEMAGKELTSVNDRGTIFGEMSALTNRNRSTTVTTTRDSSFFVIDDIVEFLGKNPELSVQLLRLMAERIDKMNHLLTDKRRWWYFF